MDSTSEQNSVNIIRWNLKNNG